MNTQDSLPNINPGKLAYGMSLQEQNKILNFALKFIKEMRVGTRTKTYAPFQKGLLISIMSVRGLLQDTIADYGAQFIMTSHINQDYLENYFLQIRSMEKSHVNPNALEFQHRLKRMICGKALITPKTASVKQSEDLQMLSSRIFKQLLEKNSQIESLITSKPVHELPADLVIDRLTNIDWTYDKNRDISLEDCPQCDRSEEGGIEYVAGYIAKKLLETHPEMADSGSRNGFWVRYLTEGGLCEPSKLWLYVFKKFDEVFRSLHNPKSIDKTPGIVNRLTRLLGENFKEVPRDVVKYFSTQRVLFRTNYLNRMMEDEKFIKQERKREHFKNRINGAHESVEEACDENQILEELEDNERDLAILEDLIESFTLPSVDLVDEAIRISINPTGDEVIMS